MAIWESIFHLIPKDNLLNINDFKEPFSDEMIYWPNNNNLFPSTYYFFSKLFLEFDEWDEFSKYFGEKDSSQLIISFDGNDITEVTLKLDLRVHYLNFLEKVLNFSNKFELFYLTVDFYVLNSDLKLLKDYINRSEASKFVVNPMKYIDQFGTSKKKL